MSAEQLSLRLIGYYRCAGHGFAMPLFGQAEGANTLYLARCSTSGDHRGKIAAFEPVDVDDQRRLPRGESIAVEVGDPWQDIFLWNDTVYVGTPEQLWAELTPFHADLEARAPLSLLDIAVQAERDELAELAPAAMAFVAARFGEGHARSWRRQYVRQQSELALRRALADHQSNDSLFQAVMLIELGHDTLTLDLPSALLQSIVEREAAKLAIARVSKLATLLGVSLVLSTDVTQATAQLEQVAPLESPISPIRDSTLLQPQQAGREPQSVVIIAQGRRAREVVSHIRSPRSRDMRLDGAGWNVVFGEKVASNDFQDPSPEVIILVLDEIEPGVDVLTPGLVRFLEGHARQGSLIILAPALPISRPSSLFESSRYLHRVGGIHAILDTAIARSPFWWGSPKRSFDRRVSDVLHLAAAAGRAPVLRRELLERRRDEAPPILSIGMLPKAGNKESLIDGPGNLRLGSEASWVSSDPKRNDPAIMFSVRLNADGSDSQVQDERLIAEARRYERRFPEFAGHVLASIIGRRGKRRDGERRIDQQPDLPAGLAKRLRAPNYAGAFSVGPGSSMPKEERLNIVITAETPSIDAIEHANALGWRIARYTDNSTLRELADDPGRDVTFPDEIDIGPIRSHEINRRVATRGIDQRDVFRVSYDLLSEWLDGLPPNERQAARANARPLRSASRPYAELEQDHLLLREYVLGPTPAARQLRSLVDPRSQRASEVLPMKRPADLVKCWTRPPQGFRRFAVVDGVVPAIVFELRPDEVAGQDLFVIDGDHAVPALFRSRIFAVWARATLPSASSWAARFSVANTFGGLPLVQPFRVVTREGGLVGLVAGQGFSRLAELVDEISKYVERALASQPMANWKEAHRIINELTAMDELNEMILDAYGLPGDADDVRILRRLQEMNTKF